MCKNKNDKFDFFKKLKENENIEYKRCNPRIPKTIWESYSAFANTNGGYIILGIYNKNDNQPENELVGVVDVDKILKELLNSLNDKNKISYNTVKDDDIKIIDIDDNKKLISLYVNEASYNKKPIYINNKINLTYIRKGESDRLATEEELKSLIANSNEELDTELLDNFDIYDLNEKTILRYRDILSETDPKINYAAMSIKEFLINLGVFRRDRRNNKKDFKLTLGGLLFFGKYNSICDKIQRFQIDYFEKDHSLSERWIERVSSGDMEYPELNVFDFFLIVYDKLKKTCKDIFILDSSGKRLPIKSDLEIVLREALVNTLMHAYYNSEITIKINAYSDYYEFENPGKMRVSIEEFVHGGISKIRNPIISTLLRRIGYSEKAGTGGQKIIDTANKYNFKLPGIETNVDKTYIKIWKIDIEKTLNDLDDTEKLMINYIIKNHSITRKILSEKLKLTESKYRKALRSLQNKGYIEKSGNGPATEYILKRNSYEEYYSVKKAIVDLEDSLKNVNKY